MKSKVLSTERIKRSKLQHQLYSYSLFRTLAPIGGNMMISDSTLRRMLTEHDFFPVAFPFTYWLIQLAGASTKDFIHHKFLLKETFARGPFTSL
jgi:hypothetical protein